MDNKRSNNSSQNNIFTRNLMGPLLLMGLMLTAVVYCFLILKPYLYPIILAGVFAMIFYPAYQFVLKKVKNRENLASIITCALISLFVIVPLITFASMLVVKGSNTYLSIQTWIESGNLEKELEAFGLRDPKTEGGAKKQLPVKPEDNTFDFFGGQDSPDQIEEKKAGAETPREPILTDSSTDDRIAEPVEKKTWKKKVGNIILIFYRKVLQKQDKAALEREVMEKSKQALSFLAPKALDQAKKGIGMVVSFFLMMFILFYLFRDGLTIMEYLIELSPLKKEHEQLLIERVKSVTRSAVIGTFLTAVAQGILGMIIFPFVGIPWFFWGVVMGFASLIPVVGTALVWVPCCGFLLITGNVWQAVALAVYCVVVVGSADNFLRPYFMKGDTGMSSIIAFFAILGGIEFFGLIGVVFGPLVFGVCAMLLYIFKLEVQSAAEPAPVKKKRRPRRRKPKSLDGEKSQDS